MSGSDVRQSNTVLVDFVQTDVVVVQYLWSPHGSSVPVSSLPPLPLPNGHSFPPVHCRCDRRRNSSLKVVVSNLSTSFPSLTLPQSPLFSLLYIELGRYEWTFCLFLRFLHRTNFLIAISSWRSTSNATESARSKASLTRGETEIQFQLCPNSIHLRLP